MMRMLSLLSWYLSASRVLVLLVILGSALPQAHAQFIDPYLRVTDPRAITKLVGNDVEPLRFHAQHGLPALRDELGYVILAQDSGAGIISHFWSASGLVDSTTDFRIYIDGKLISSSSLLTFFGSSRGTMRPPLDTAYGGGLVSDLQMPYQKSFRVTLKCQDWNFYYAIAWRPISNPQSLKPFSAYPPQIGEFYQKAAERRLRDETSPWARESSERLEWDRVLQPNANDTLLAVRGPGFLKMLRFRLQNWDPRKHDSIWLRVFYDGSPFPSVDVPLFDFFCSSTKVTNVRGFHIRADVDSGFISYIPMPFVTSIRVELVNMGGDTMPYQAEVVYGSEHVDVYGHGYFHASFSESNPTRYGVFHPVLNVKGRGKFIGLYHAIPKCPFPVALEGDPVITVDSNEENFMRYTGGEDYYNGGWWFLGRTFSVPFAGFTHPFESFYRFHILDAIDFKTSFNFKLQHGVDNDVRNRYRTTAYYYKRWTPFWVYRDTIRGGEDWVIEGAGYKPKEKIDIRLEQVLIVSLFAKEDGTFSQRIRVPGHWTPGRYTLSVNGTSRPEPIYVLQTPAIKIVCDFSPTVQREGDSIVVRGNGFIPGDRVTFYLDSIAIAPDKLTIAEYDYSVQATLWLPYLPDHDYHLVARGEYSGEAIAEVPVRMTRTHVLEFENLLPPIAKSEHPARREDVSYYWYSKWSQQSFAVFEATARDSFISFGFDLPRADTFDIKLFASVGKKLGNYEYLIDGDARGSFVGYRELDYGDIKRSDTIDAGVMFLDSGRHVITFRCLGKEDSAQSAWICADNIILKPIHDLPPAPGTWVKSDVQDGSRSLLLTQIYPNPASDVLYIHVGTEGIDPTILPLRANLSIVDPLGRRLYTRSVVITGNEPLMLDVSKLPVGSYVISVETGLHRLSGQLPRSVLRVVR